MGIQDIPETMEAFKKWSKVISSSSRLALAAVTH
jgi:hypothetical protein